MSLFEDFSEFLRSISPDQLPGWEGQMLMSPMGRGQLSDQMLDKLNPKSSAVLVLLYPDEGRVRTVLMLRNTYDGHHSGQVSFPGGKKEKEDLDLRQTALREFEEETGVLKDEIEVVGRLSNLFIPPSGFLVEPHIGITHNKPVFAPDPVEVERLLTPSLDILFSESVIEERTVLASSQNIRIKAPCYVLDEYVIWGATAMMVSELKELSKRFFR
jgi:8-oxo-dGTP pyrophosphatase MutT (NUDIX family)